MTNKEFIERLKANDYIYETDENGNVVITKTAGEIFEHHFKKLEEDLERLEKQDKLLNALIENADFPRAECYLVGSNPCILICIDDRDECFDEILKRVTASLDKRDEAYYSNTLSRYKGPLLTEVLKNE